MNLILMGAPGAGKGTQAAKISEKYQIPAIATGDILRAELKAGTELGKQAQTYLELGQLVPDSVVIGIIKEYLASAFCLCHTHAKTVNMGDSQLFGVKQ